MTEHFIGKPKVRFLTCVWGSEHRARWLVLSLPSLLAAGNLPALAAHTDMEVIILTDRKSVRPIRGHPAFRKLEELCQVRFLSIDDLIVGTTYGATLTLAYARGIMDAGAEQTRTTFVFMNSDFILADGSLATLAGRILAGHRCIVVPSLRASAERLLPSLRKAVKQNRLSLKPRALVEMALANLHLTVLAKIAGSEFQCVSFNQVYWRLGHSTLLGRYHLLFMLCIRPERPLGPISSYCDYGFIPELVPSSPLVPLTDSDEFFALELGPEHQEANLLRGRPANPGLIARRLRQWTTKEHRQSADFDFIFHSGSIPQNLNIVKKKAASFVAELHARMGKRPVSHVDHHYWVRGLQHWLRAKAAGPVVQLPPELAGGRIAKWLVPYARVIAWMQGTPPNVPIRAYDWNDYQIVREWFSSLGEMPEKSVLFVCPDDSRLRDWLAADARVEILTTWNHRIPVSKNSKRYRYILLHAHVNALHKPDRVLKPLLARLASGGEFAIFVGGRRRRPDRDSLNPGLANFIRQFLWQHSGELSWDGVFVNGYLQRLAGALLFRVSDMSFDDFLKSRPRWAPFGVVASLILISVITILNACSVDRLALLVSNYRSAALLRMRRIDETTENYNFGERRAT